jgi:hypothetical protein
MDELREIEARLNELKLGISVELDKFFHDENAKTEWNDDGEPIGDYYKAWSLGYGKNQHGDWCFLVREYRVPSTPEGTYPMSVVEQDATPLLDASRDLRIAAAEKIPELLQQIEAEVKKKIDVLAKVSDKR